MTGQARAELASQNSPIDPLAARVLVIIPAYNEARCLREVITQLIEFYPTYELLVVNDGSDDETEMIARRLPVRLISHPFNLGIGSAVQTGLQVALREGFDLAVQVDGDGQHPAAQVRDLVNAICEEGYDIAIGSRFTSGQGYRSSLWRRLGIRIFRWILLLMCGIRVSDPTSGFRAMGRRAIHLLAGQYAQDYPEVEATVVSRRAGLRITEVPVEMRERAAGKSSIGPLEAMGYMLKVPLAICMTLLRQRAKEDAECANTARH